MIYLGLDPGKGGGIAALDSHGVVVSVVPMPETEQDILDFLRPITAADGACAVLEFVRSSPQMGVASAFTFGRGYGGLRMALAALQIPYTEVLPAKWQQALGCRSKGDKNVTKRRAQELFPRVKVTHAIADALLLAEYARRGEAPRYFLGAGVKCRVTDGDGRPVRVEPAGPRVHLRVDED